METSVVVAEPINVEFSPRQQGAMVPRSIAELQSLANLMFSSGLMPTSIKSPEAVAVAVMAGLEVGISPMSAVQNIAVINGRPAIWGDAMLAVVQASGKLEDYDESPIIDASGNVVGFRCRAIRRGQSTPIEDTYTMDDARKAKLDKKPGPWSEYPQRMLRLRARGFVLRNGFADVLRGMISAEEANDFPATNRALDRAPIATPRQQQREDRGPTPAITNPTHAPAAVSDNEVRGVVAQVSVKQGNGKKGAWTKYGVRLGDNWYGTFDRKLGELAEYFRDSASEVVVAWEQDGDYRTLTAIRAADMVDNTAPREREPGDDDPNA